MEFYTRETLLNAIDDLAIYEDEYDLLSGLISNTSDVFFTRILEEIFNKNISFSDFNQIFPEADYRRMLSENLSAEAALKERIDRYEEFRENEMTTDNLRFVKNNMIINDVQATDDVYQKEVENIRNTMLYSLFDDKDSSILEKTTKQALITFIKEYFEDNVYSYTKLTTSTNLPLYATDSGLVTISSSGTTYIGTYSSTAKKLYVSDQKMIVTEDYSYSFIKSNAYSSLKALNTAEGTLYYNSSKNITLKSRNMEPQDVLNKILLFANKGMVPIDTEYQILDKADVNFMLENHLTDSQMKKIKALSLFIKKKDLNVLLGTEN